MESTGIQRLFYILWAIIKLNLYILVFTLAGGIVLGMGPAFQSANDVLLTSGMDYQNITFGKMAERFKANFKRSNGIFWIFAALLGIVAYNLFLASQIKGLLWFILSFVLFFAILLLLVVYLYAVQYETTYDISIGNLLKLAFISVFLNFGTFLKVLFGVISILVVTWFFKGLLLFATFSLFLVWSGYATKNIRHLVEGKLV
ncbi:YesL family protein [Enterococcus diestrammenae]|uniref:YesL family protein n=1 Tax=Enterococcus diestrammenae TaxID=1155073 RepID=UPI00195EFBC7